MRKSNRFFNKLMALLALLGLMMAIYFLPWRSWLAGLAAACAELSGCARGAGSSIRAHDPATARHVKAAVCDPGRL